MTGLIRKYVSVVKPYLTMKEIGQTYSLLMPYMLRKWKAYLGLFTLLFIDVFIMLAFSWFFGNITDAAIQGDLKRMKGLVPFGISLVLISITSTYLNTLLETVATTAVKRDFSAYFFKHILMLPGRHIASLHSGELLSHFTNDIHSIDGVIGRSLINLIRLPLTYIAVFIYLVQMNWKLALLSVCIAPIALIFGVVFGILIRNNSRLLHSLVGSMNSLLSETFQGFFVIRSFKMEKSIFTKYRGKNQEMYTLELKNAKLRGWFYVGGQAVSTFAFLVSLCLGAYFVSMDVMTVGSLLIFVNLVNHLVYPLTELAGQWAGFQRSASAMERILKVLEHRTEARDLPEELPAETLLTSIRLDNLTFSYDGQTSLFDKLNMQIPVGKHIALVGPSGAGKTTLFNLLLGFYKPHSGHIWLDERSTKFLSPSELRSYFAHVPQETFLFGGTLRENLQAARSSITDAEMVQAAIVADIHSFIESLPDGYDTQIGERGIRLSGGQKQRIAIARALLKDAPILLVDEGTSALDSQTEYQVKEALDRLMKNRTTLVIAHRLSTIHHADLILVMDRGRIVQQGRHEELIAENGLYRSLYDTQFQRGAAFVDHSFNSSIV
jgi:ATP-binding cassette subfamily B protein